MCFSSHWHAPEEVSKHLPISSKSRSQEWNCPFNAALCCALKLIMLSRRVPKNAEKYVDECLGDQRSSAQPCCGADLNGSVLRWPGCQPSGLFELYYALAEAVLPLDDLTGGKLGHVHQFIANPNCVGVSEVRDLDTPWHILQNACFSKSGYERLWSCCS